VVIGIAVLVVTGCGKSEPAAPAGQTAGGAAGQPAAQAAQTAAQVAQQMAQGLQQQAGQAAVTPVDSDALKALLPDMDGWEKKNTKGEQVSVAGFSSSHVVTHYSKGDSTIELEITDTSLNPVMLAPLSMFMAVGYSEKSDEGYKKSTTVSGSPGFEDWNKDARRGELTAVVANRFIVHGTGHEVDSVDPVRKVIEAVNLPKLAGMK
jgi:hypothetical protein